ncbi:hypothetical protein HYV73_03650 [Candidatus Uhrbacteria bacterium]|nr:hypothetical protein [Candidatus Uhrbacteria bacterium]
MTLLLLIKILGIIMMGLPMIVFLVVSGYAILGSAEDDAMVKGLLYLGLAMFLIGALIIGLVYLTDFFPKLIALPGRS